MMNLLLHKDFECKFLNSKTEMFKVKSKVLIQITEISGLQIDA